MKRQHVCRIVTTMISQSLLVFLIVSFLSDFSYAQKDKKFFRQDYNYIEAVEGFYKIHNIRQTWFDAKRVCALEGASLFYPENDNEARAVIALWNQTQPGIEYMFVGMSDLMIEGVFETIDGKPVSEVFNTWKPNEPNNAGGNENCGNLYKQGYINDCPCDMKMPFICKKSLQSLQWNYYCNMSDIGYTFNADIGKCYKFHTTPLNWMEAYAVCVAEQSYLAVVNNEQEANYLASLTESASRIRGRYLRGMYHVGFHNKFNEGWRTVRGTPLNEDQTSVWWGDYQPDGDDRERCGSMFYTGTLTHVDCVMKSFFFCEHEANNATLAEEKRPVDSVKEMIMPSKQQ